MIRFPDSWRILVTGVTSIHGWPVYQALQKVIPEERLFGIRPPKMRVPKGLNTRNVCITDKDELIRIKDVFHPTHVIHCSGVCDLDVCEERPAWAASINTDGTRAIADVFGKECLIVYLSTDLVFSGEEAPQHGYAEHHETDPISVAGKTFAAAEQELMKSDRYCIVRLGLPIGPSITGDKGAIDWIGSRFKRNLPVTLFEDEFRSCISCSDIAEIIQFLLVHEVERLYHCGGPAAVSLHQIGKWVLQSGGYPTSLLKGILRSAEKNGPPRIGDVSLNSEKLIKLMGDELKDVKNRLIDPRLSPCYIDAEL